MDIFKASEVLDVAIGIEENGEKLYRHAVDLTDDPKMKDFFKYVADEEVKHKKTFQGMLSGMEHAREPEKYPGEYCEYVRAYASNIVFPAEILEKEISKIGDVQGALEFAIQREIEAILYFLEMKNFVPDTHKKQIDKIIDEERRHYLKLNDIKRELQ
jgi:rubrerythrin